MTRPHPGTEAGGPTASDASRGTPGAARGLTRRWRPRGANPPPGLHLVDRVLHARGLAGDAASDFLDTSLRRLTPPEALPGINRAAERILTALDRRERIVIFGDYDVDGVTATAILVRMIRSLDPAADIDTYVPHRIDEGYGLNEDAVASIAASDAKVIVTVDCGVTATAPAARARRLGVDLIITDHHNPPTDPADLPDAFAIVHPRVGGAAEAPIPGEELCGAGVAYKLAWRLATMRAGGDRAGPDQRTLLVDLLALAALGTIADMVPLVGDSRIIAKFGLSRCASAPFAGLRALIHSARLDSDKIDAESVGFRLGPRLNACGRLAHSRDAVELLLTEDPHRAAAIASELCELNDERRATERAISEHALRLAREAGCDRDDTRAVVLAHEDWHPGVVGIVCSRLVEALARPAILMQRVEADGRTICKGSGRGVPGFNLHAALEACAEHLLGFGGHDAAAGLTLDARNLDAFRDAFVAIANDRITAEELTPVVDYDAEVTLGEITTDAVRQIEAFGPFGAGNPKVRLRLTNSRVAAPPRLFGATGKHLDLRVEDADRPGGRPLRLCAWNWAPHAERFRRGMPVEAIITPTINRWQGRTSCEGMLDDAMTTGATPEIVVTPRGQSVGATA